MKVFLSTLISFHSIILNPYSWSQQKRFWNKASRCRCLNGTAKWVAYGNDKELEETNSSNNSWGYHRVFSESAENELYIPAGTEKQQDWLENDRNKAPPCDHSSGETQMKNTVELEKWLLNHHHPPTACYYDLTNNTSTPCLGSSDFPWPEGTPYFVSHSVVQNYYQNYVTHFGLDEHMHLNTALDALVKRGNKWELTLTRAITSGNEQVSIRQYQAAFDGVVLATGQFQNPVIPIMDGLQEYASLFPGKIIHSKQFKRTQDLENKVNKSYSFNILSVLCWTFTLFFSTTHRMSWWSVVESLLWILPALHQPSPNGFIWHTGVHSKPVCLFSISFARSFQNP